MCHNSNPHTCYSTCTLAPLAKIWCYWMSYMMTVPSRPTPRTPCCVTRAGGPARANPVGSGALAELEVTKTVIIYDRNSESHPFDFLVEL